MKDTTRRLRTALLEQGIRDTEIRIGQLTQRRMTLGAEIEALTAALADARRRLAELERPGG